MADHGTVLDVVRVDSQVTAILIGGRWFVPKTEFNIANCADIERRSNLLVWAAISMLANLLFVMMFFMRHSLCGV
jgi:hypothetical protein